MRFGPFMTCWAVLLAGTVSALNWAYAEGTPYEVGDPDAFLEQARGKVRPAVLLLNVDLDTGFC